MSKTARMVMKIIGASLAFAAFVCLLIGGWHDLSVGCCGMKKRLTAATWKIRSWNSLPGVCWNSRSVSGIEVLLDTSAA